MSSLLSRVIIPYTALIGLIATSAIATLSPGTYFIQSVGFPNERILAGNSPGIPLSSQEGLPLTTFDLPFPQIPPSVNHIWTLDPSMTTLFHEEAQQFAVTDASAGGMAGAGVFLCNTTAPVPPFIPLGNTEWEFVQGTNGMFVLLSGTNLVWAIQATAFSTQVTIQTQNPSDLRQQWSFIPHGLV